jgi:hypothetical protein
MLISGQVLGFPITRDLVKSSAAQIRGASNRHPERAPVAGVKDPNRRSPHFLPHPVIFQLLLQTKALAPIDARASLA